MTGLETVAVSLVALWLGVLTLVVVLLVRQLGLTTVRLDRMSSVTGAGLLANDGLIVGSPVPDVVGEVVGDSNDAPRYLVILSATCAPCREVAIELGDARIDADLTVVVTGREEAADPLAALLPRDLRVVRDPVGKEITEALEINTSPFAFQIERGTITGKAVLRSAADLTGFIDARDPDPSDLVKQPTMEVVDVTR